MKILILTDHTGHSVHNSVYGLATALAGQPEVAELWIATRGDQRNQAFFQGESAENLLALPYFEGFGFPAGQFFAERSVPIVLSEFDIIFLRLPRPIPTVFFPFLSRNFPENQIVNRPSGIEKTGNKAWLVNFPQLTAPTALVTNLEEMEAFAARFPCVLKPLEEFGGKGIVRAENGMVELEGEKMPWEAFAKTWENAPQPYLAMKFLRNVSQGDKRILVVGGEVLLSSVRLPAPGSWLCNIAQGGSDHPAPPDDRELEIIRELDPELRREGIFYYGLDTLVNDDGRRVVSEVNTLSIGGIDPSEKKSGKPLNRMFAERFITHCKELLWTKNTYRN
ncbi:MAG: glutathione synthetase [Bacteroidia bacterium]|nr:glutathione synthetase [Bacteroidia bacterium]